jgi:cobalamin biosynthesis protein CobD/CbiB
MYNDYEESFYYDKPSSISSGISGEAVGPGLGLGVGLISTIISGLLFLIARIDILSSSLLGLLFYLLTYRFEWNKPVYFIGVILTILVSMMLQHIFKVFRILYGIFTCVAVSLFASALIGRSTDANMYKTMVICFVVTAVWTAISWKCIIRK